jgi:hypothetical protein
MQKNLTILAIDTAYHALTKKAVEKAVEVTGSKNVVILSDQNILPGSTFVKIDPIDAVGYNRMVLKDLAPYINTDHFMIVQYDGMPYHTEFWNDDFLKYDYIGAPWPWGPENRRVGNGGFSIRSRKLIEVCQDPAVVFNPPEFGGGNVTEDTHICHMYRDFLESKGINFAPLSLANEFSAETPGGLFSTYGFHGTLCLPFYLSDEHMEFYIDNLDEKMLTNPIHIRIFFGLFRAQRYDLLQHYMYHAVKINPNFPDVLLTQFPQETQFYPEINVEDLEQLLAHEQ